MRTRSATVCDELQCWLRLWDSDSHQFVHVANCRQDILAIVHWVSNSDHDKSIKNIKHKNIKHKNTKHKNIKHKNTKHKSIKHKNTKHKSIKHKNAILILLCRIWASVLYGVFIYLPERKNSGTTYMYMSKRYLLISANLLQSYIDCFLWDIFLC